MNMSLIARITQALKRFEQFILPKFPAESLSFVEINDIQPKPFSLRDIFNDGFLWAVPKSRRTIEKRLNRKFGHPDYVWKMLKPKSTIKTCNTCGDDYEAGLLCPTCYKKVIEETKEMRETIQEKLQLDPVDKEVVVLYQGENEQTDEFHDGKRIVEMKKPRPAWFTKNLLQQTSQKPATTKDVKPSELG